jgi:hypothetical protein
LESKCNKECGYCDDGASTPAPCVDLSPGNCRKLTRARCNINSMITSLGVTAKSYMHSKCKKTCDLCDASAAATSAPATVATEPTATEAPCEDTKGTEWCGQAGVLRKCNSRAAVNAKTTITWNTYLRAKCTKSCGFCEGTR